MVTIAIVAVAAIVAGCLIVELLSSIDPRSQFLFALLDHLVSDESPLEVPPLPMRADKALTHRVA